MSGYILKKNHSGTVKKRITVKARREKVWKKRFFTAYKRVFLLDGNLSRTMGSPFFRPNSGHGNMYFMPNSEPRRT